MTNDLKLKMKEYGIKAVPTTIIDGKIKVVGIPDFPWVCGDDLYTKLKKDYRLKQKIVFSDKKAIAGTKERAEFIEAQQSSKHEDI